MDRAMKHRKEAGGPMRSETRVHLAVILSFALIAISFEPKTVNSSAKALGNSDLPGYSSLTKRNIPDLARGKLGIPTNPEPSSSSTMSTTPNSGYPRFSTKVGGSVRLQKSASEIAKKPTTIRGQTTTLLPNGEYLLIGGEGSDGVVATAAIEDAKAGTTKELKNGLRHPRAWHTSTLLPDGTVFVFGGEDNSKTLVSGAEIFDPVADLSHDLALPAGLLVRAHHTATLLTDGRVLLAGGIGADGDLLGSLQTWDSRSGTTQLLSALLSPRRDHTANLVADGGVLFWGGTASTGLALNYGELFDPSQEAERIITGPDSLKPQGSNPFLEASLPSDGATDVGLSPLIAVRFSEPLAVQSVTADTVSLSADGTAVAAQVVPAEGGMLAFLTPAEALTAGITYTLAVNGATNGSGSQIESASISFTTTDNSAGSVAAVPGTGEGNDERGPLDNTAFRLPALRARAGETALAGQVLKLNGKPLAHVLLQIDDKKAYSGGTGRFLIDNLTQGHHVMIIDGTAANHDHVEYGIYEDGVDITNGQTNVLNYPIWMTALDTANEVTIPSPTTSEVVVTTPKLPGLELHLPPGTVIHDRNGKVVTTISITPIPVNQPPFPLPQGVRVPIYFTIQPGAAYIDVANYSEGKTGARLIYPNAFHYPAGTIFDFWNYNADDKGWFIYGHGKVSQDAQSIVPDPGVEIYEFTGAMVSNPPGGAPGTGGTAGDGSNGGDPVNLSSGLFVYNKTDLVLPDVIPLKLERTYRPNDNQSRAFGIGTTHWYEMFVVGDSNPYTYQDLILPDGSRIHFYRTSSGTTYSNAVYAHTLAGTSWYGATISFNTSAFPGAVWVLTTKNGMNYYFPDSFSQTNPAKMALVGIRDRYGNTVTVTRDSSGNVTQITSPNGRSITFQHDTSNRITQAQDNTSRTVLYQYDAVGRIQQVTDAAGGIWKYTYDTNNNMLTIQDARGITYLTNQYDSGNHVIKQTQADGSTYQFSWTFTSNTAQPPYFVMGGISPGGSSSQVMTFRSCSTCSAGYNPLLTQVDVTDPNGNVKRVKFGPTGYTTSTTYALGKPEQQTYTYTYYADNLLQTVTDPLGRVTSYVYDANGNLTSVTQLSGTPSAVTTTMTYDSTFNQLLSVTDPLNHATNFTLDTRGNVIAVTDPLNHQTTVSYDSEGHPLTTTDALGNTTNLVNSLVTGDLVSTADPLGRTISRSYDGVGRVTSVTDPVGNKTQFAYNALNQITSTTDPLGNITSLSYDPNGNLLSVTDAKNHTTQYTYNNMDRLATRKDPLLNQESYQYDGNGNLTQFTDRRGKVTTYNYDGLNRRTFAGFGTISGPPPTYESTVNYSYGNITCGTLQCYTMTATDSISGAITRTDDALDRLASETTPQGTVGYAYDAAGRRSSLTVSGQAAANYTFDNANRLTQIVQGSTTVSFSYDNANRRTTLTLPNGITTSYSYDNASRLTGLTYAKGSNTMGNLTYGYDLNGRRTNIGGSFATGNLPNAVSTTAYNGNNQLATWGTANLFYDLNGNMTSDGTHSYTWDARNRLKQLDSGTTASFTYDSFGRRVNKNILGTTTNFLYDGGNAVQEVIGGTNTANSLMGGIDEVFQRTDSSGARSFLADALGSTIALADSSGTIQTQYTFDPFGNTTPSGSSTTNSFAYTGRELDLTGLYFNRARYYSSTLQRFIAEDPLGATLKAGNFYAYANNRPIDSIDPLGLWTLQVGGSVSLTFIPIIGGTLNASGGFAIDSNGNIATYGATGAGGSLGGQGSIGVTVAVSNAQTVNDLAGPFLNVSGSGGAGAFAGADGFVGNSPHGIVTGGGVTAGAGIGGSVGANVTNTTITPLGNIFGPPGTSGGGGIPGLPPSGTGGGGGIPGLPPPGTGGGGGIPGLPPPGTGGGGGMPGRKGATG
jgi:RHS repeat-associated protein